MMTVIQQLNFRAAMILAQMKNMKWVLSRKEVLATRILQ